MLIHVNEVVTLLEIFDMPRSLAFYRDLLGFEVVASAGDDWAMLKLGGASLMLNTRYESDDRPPGRTQREWLRTTIQNSISIARTWTKRIHTYARRVWM